MAMVRPAAGRLLLWSVMKIALAFLAATGCAATDPTTEPVATEPEQTEQPEPVRPVASGTYQVRSTIDLTVEAVLPDQAAGYVATLRDFEANPAQTLFDLAESAGVPAVGEIRAALPSYVEDKLEGWINAEINKLPVVALAGDVVAIAETAITQFALDSKLTIDASTATHTLTGIDFAPAGLTARFDLSAANIAQLATCTTTNATLSIGDHVYGLPYGEYVWDAIEAQYGGRVRAALGAAIDCTAVAEVVASKCYWGACVGHATELTAICEKGLDEAVARAQAKVEELRFDALHFAAGTATVGTNALTDGVWTAEINAGMGLRPVPATFTATK